MGEARKREQQLRIDAELATSQLNLAQASAYKGLEATTFEVGVDLQSVEGRKYA